MFPRKPFVGAWPNAVITCPIERSLEWNMISTGNPGGTNRPSAGHLLSWEGTSPEDRDGHPVQRLNLRHSLDSPSDNSYWPCSRWCWRPTNHRRGVSRTDWGTNSRPSDLGYRRNLVARPASWNWPDIRIPNNAWRTPRTVLVIPLPIRQSRCCTSYFCSRSTPAQYASPTCPNANWLARLRNMPIAAPADRVWPSTATIFSGCLG